MVPSQFSTFSEFRAGGGQSAVLCCRVLVCRVYGVGFNDSSTLRALGFRLKG